MLTDKQKETFQKLKDGKLTASERADFYYRLSGILKRDLEGLKDLSRLLDEIPEGNLKKINMMGAALTAMKLTEKLIQKLKPPHVQPKIVNNKYVGFSAIQKFDLGPYNQKYYIEDKEGKQEVKSFGYSFTRELTSEEKELIYNLSWYIDDLRQLLTPNRVPLDCTLEDFLQKKLPSLIEDAKQKGVAYQTTIDICDTIEFLDNIANTARQIKADKKEGQEERARPGEGGDP